MAVPCPMQRRFLLAFAFWLCHVAVTTPSASTETKKWPVSVAFGFRLAEGGGKLQPVENSSNGEGRTWPIATAARSRHRHRDRFRFGRDCRDALRKIDEAAARWPRPLLNPPASGSAISIVTSCICCFCGIEGLDIPGTVGGVARAIVRCRPDPVSAFADVAAELEFPVIARPRGSHAGVGLAKTRRSPGARSISQANATSGILHLPLRQL